jgi:multidrug efflux pump subunit AcrA (membrane-fusion protein)
MNSKVLFPLILTLALAACAGGAKNLPAVPTVMLGNEASTPAANNNTGGGVTASGVVVADQEADMAFRLAGNVKLVEVAVGDQVQTGQLLVQLEDTTQQIQLEQAKLALQELSSPSALAAAQEAVAQDQQDLYNAQVALNNVITQAGLVLAQEALDNAQNAYDETPGKKDSDPGKAFAYQKLYAAQQSYNHILYIYNLYSGKPNQSQVDEATAKVALATAMLAEDQSLVTALTGGNLPENASGTGYARLRQAKLDVQMAQANLDATRLVAPFPGEVAFVTASNGDYISPGQVLLVISDVKHLHIETTDLSERDVPRVGLGQTTIIHIKALNQEVGGKVTAISPLADTLGGDVVYKVTIALDELPSNLRAGMSVEVQFNPNQ